MNIGFEGLLILSTVILLSYLTYSTFFDTKLEAVKSTLDNREYYVQADKEDAKDAANLIAEIRKRIILLVEHIYKTFPPDDKIVVLLKENFNPDVFKEGDDNSGYTSYSVNKGEEIILCLRSKNKLMDINVMMFVAIHELAHLANETVGHDMTFWDTFKTLLLEAINIGIYVNHDFDKQPVEYCGMTINSNPLD
jgi:hypothetical protein